MSKTTATMRRPAAQDTASNLQPNPFVWRTAGMDDLKTLSYWRAIAGILLGFFAGLLLGYRLAKTLMP